MSKQNKKDQRQALTIEIEQLERRILNCYFKVEYQQIEKRIKELIRKLKCLG